MARPTDDKKETTLILRVNEETKSRLERESKERGESMSSIIRSRLAGDSSLNNVSSNIYEELESIGAFVGKSVDELLEVFVGALYEGTVTISKDGIGTDLNMTPFREACKGLGVDCQSVIDDMTERLRSGDIWI